jgi:peptidoglycan/LPS O-acetylase OafA/YrhL
MPIDAAGIFTFATLDSLGGGALLALFRYDERLRTRLPTLMKSFLIAGLGIVTLCTVFYIYNIGFRILHTFLCLGISLLFVVLIEKTARGFTGKARTVMEASTVLYIGKISYGLYVYHNFMLAIVLYYLLKRTAVPDYRLVALLATVATFAAAIVSWHLIERPVAQLKNRLDVNFRRTRLVPESVQFRPSEKA